MSTPKPFVSDEQIKQWSAARHPLRTITDPDRPEHPFDVNFDARRACSSAMESMRTHYEPHVQQLVRERDNLRAFIENVIQCESWGRIDYLDGGSVQDEAERMGILVEVPHELPCTKELCGCEGEDVDYLYNFAWRISTPNTPPSNEAR